MNIAEILRKLADAVEQEESPGQPDEKIQNPAALKAVPLPASAGRAVETPDNQDVAADDDIMVPPLQLKTELLKRAVGVDNIYDADGPRADQASNGEDELSAIRRIAGVPAAAIQELSNDEIVDD